MNRFKKQFFNLFLILAFALSLVGCGSTGTAQGPTETKKSTVVTTTAPVQNTSKSVVKVQEDLKIHYLNVGQADSILIQQGSSNMLIDAGNNGDSKFVLNYLKQQGIKKLDYVIGTHPHEDHIGSLDTVINTFQIGKVFMPKKTSTTVTYRDVITSIKNKGLKITAPIPGTKYNLGQATWTILAPTKNEDYKDVNNYSIVCKLQYGNTSFIFTGDAEDVSESEILSRNYNLKADVLKVGHHGSHSSTTNAFLSAVNPKYAVISCGKGNDYGHPHKETMEKLESKRIPVYRTDECGTIICTSDGTKITFDKKPGDYKYNQNSTSSKNTTSSTIIKSNTKPTSSTSSTVAKSSTKPTSNTSTSVTSNNNNNKTVYFTPHGKSYHYSKNCRTLKRSKTILQGSLQEAINSGHSDPCNVCAGGN